MMPIVGPATLPRSIARILATARRARGTFCVPPLTRIGSSTPIDGDRLFAYWENTLDTDARRAVEAEAESCEECRRWLEEVGKMFGTLSR